MNSSLISFVFLVVSLAGWGMFIHKKLKINAAFIPLFLFSSITCLVFAAGLLNIMPLMVSLIFYAGILLFVLCIYLLAKKKYSIKNLLVPSSLVFVLFSVAIVLLLKSLILIHYDNFSHWGLIVKEMFRINGLPDGTTMISFRNYPPGSAVFIYFIGKIIGYTESHALMAQGILIASNIAVLSVFCKWKKISHLLLSIVLSTVLLAVIKNNLYNLLVDTLLGFTALSISIIAYYYRADWKKSMIINTPLMILLTLIKDSGKFFLIINIVLIVWLIYVHYIKGKKPKMKHSKILVYAMVFMILVPLGSNFLWLKYTQKAYPEASYSSNKFAVNIDKVNNNEKSEEFKETLAPSLIDAAANFNSPLFKSLLLLNTLLVAMAFIIYLWKREKSKRLFYLFLFGNLTYVFYLFGLYFMYLFLMPEGEASKLAGFNRYNSSIVIYIAGLFMTFISYEFSKLSKNKTINAFAALVLAVLFVLPFQDNLAAVTTRPDVESSLRLQVKNDFSKVRGSHSKISHVIYYSPRSKKDRGYLKYLLMYEQLSNKYSIVTSSSTEKERKALNNLIKKSSHIVILDSDPNFNQYFSQYVSTEQIEGVYKITNTENDTTIQRLD
ncbi:hypothetical protein ABES80_05210 [Bacillus gobiensis]|uniref:hypothetical protein n=1 Tax=Bacillus gobiensis TaxID=1441095 RepID=UPI003D24FA95